MITLRPAAERGHADHGWLQTWHTFSFAHYHDPDFMGFRALRVINEDLVAPGRGFGEHPHRDMEILTYVLAGAIEHRDSMGNGSIVRAGDLQRMSAGTGVTHSEYNPSDCEQLHLLQIWIKPSSTGLTPSYQQRSFDPSARQGRLQLLASADGRDDSLTIHQDVDLYAAQLTPGDTTTHELAADHGAWLHLLRGTVNLRGTAMQTGDSAAVEAEPRIEITATGDAEVLLFDLS